MPLVKSIPKERRSPMTGSGVLGPGGKLWGWREDDLQWRHRPTRITSSKKSNIVLAEGLVELNSKFNY